MKLSGNKWIFLVPILALLVLQACKSRQQGNEAASLGTATFVGTWVAAEVDIAIHSKNQTGPDEKIHYDSKEVAANMNRKPTLTHFAGDGSYRDETYNLHDSLVVSRKGYWHFYADSLFMRPDAENSPKIAYQAVLEGRALRLQSAVDWDGDGARDDEMVVVLKRP